MNLRPLLDALDLQEDAARTLADELRAQIDDLQTRLREAAEMHLEHLTITRKTVTGLADRLPAHTPDLPEQPDYPRILAAFNHTTGPLRAKDVCEALGHELLPKGLDDPHPCWPAKLSASLIATPSSRRPSNPSGSAGSAPESPCS